jgi:hypothetical protein
VHSEVNYPGRSPERKRKNGDSQYPMRAGRWPFGTQQTNCGSPEERLDGTAGRTYTETCMSLRSRLVTASVLLSCGPGTLAPHAWAESGDTQTSSTSADLPPEVPRPYFMRNKPFLPELMIQEKEEGRYFTVMPAIGYDPNTGFNLGAFAELFNNGAKDDPFFRSTPYRQRIFLGAVWGSNEFGRVRVGLDKPYAFDSPWRIRGDATLDRLGSAFYFGSGNDSMSNLSFPTAGRDFTSYEDFKSEAERVQDGETYSRFNEYGLTRLRFNTSAELDLETFGGLVRPLVGFQVAHFWVQDYTGDTVQGIDDGGNQVDATQRTTKLNEDCQAGRILGCDGGFDNFVKLGITFDSRNFEPDPDDGIMAQVVGEFSPGFLSSSFSYVRITPSVAGFYSPFSEFTRLILAGRIVYSASFGDVPFYSQNTYGFTQEDRYGLGGFQTMRGFKQDRFIGKSGILVNLEPRWTFGSATVFDQHLRFSLVPFVDFGRVFDDAGAFTFDDWRWTAGAGFKLAWNLSTVISFDYGMNPEDQAFFMELGHQF